MDIPFLAMNGLETKARFMFVRRDLHPLESLRFFVISSFDLVSINI